MLFGSACYGQLLDRNEFLCFVDLKATSIGKNIEIKQSMSVGSGLLYKHFFTAHKGLRLGGLFQWDDLNKNFPILYSKGDSVFRDFANKSVTNYSGFAGIELQRSFFKTLYFYGFADLAFGMTSGTELKGTEFVIYGVDTVKIGHVNQTVSIRNIRDYTTQLKPGLGAKLYLKNIVVGGEISLATKLNIEKGTGKLALEFQNSLNRIYFGFRL